MVLGVSDAPRVVRDTEPICENDLRQPGINANATREVTHAECKTQPTVLLIILDSEKA